VPAFAQAPASIHVTLGDASRREAGGFLTIWADAVIAPDAAAEPVRGIFDPKAIGVSKFAETLSDTALDATGARCESPRRCFAATTNIDVYTPAGRYALPVTIADARGRTATASVTVEIAAARDADGNGLPDAWEQQYNLRDSGPAGDPDGDGVTNLQEYRNHTNPRARYQRVFADGSYGDRQSLLTCFTTTPVDPARASGGPVRILAIGDNGRSSETFFSSWSNVTSCPLGGWPPFVADRIVVVLVESEDELAVERTSLQATDGLQRTSLNASLGVQAPSSYWYFARGGTERDLDLFFLAFNPGTQPVDATFTFTGGPSDPTTTMTQTLPPGVRTTIWVNQDAPAAAAFDAATTVTASAPVYVERAWRYRAPGRTAPSDSVSRGASVPSTWWYFAIGDLSAAFDTSFAIANPSGQDASVEARLLFADRAPETRTVSVPANGRTILRPREIGIGGASVALVLHAADGVGIVAERTMDGSTAVSGAWRQSALGVTEAGASWLFATAPIYGENEMAIANPSSIDGRARIHYYTNYDYGSDSETIVDVPANRVVRVPVTNSFTGWYRVTSLPRTGTDVAPIVVERATYVDIDGVRRVRQVTIAGNLTP
jgi:hypothetical protein